MEVDPEDGELSFFTTANVVADSQEEAFELASSLEPEAVRKSLRIDEVEVVGEAIDVPTGVYETSGYAFYPRGSD